MKTKKIIASTSFLLLLLTGLSYFLLASFSEHRAYTKNSIDYWILTPSELSEVAGFCVDEPSFMYSAADGVKPLVVQLICSIVAVDVIHYLEKAKFVHEDGEIYMRDQKKIELVRDVGGKVTQVTLLTFL